MIVVTGGAGFIGANLIRALNAAGHSNVVVVDNLRDGSKYQNLVDLDIVDYLDKDEFRARIKVPYCGFDIEALFHLGACSITTEWDGRYMMDNNFSYSKEVLNYCLSHTTPMIYASSAAVYGAGPKFSEDRSQGAPLNVYGYSKGLFDRYVEHHLPRVHTQVVGLRFFNVYGPKESHKGPMASVAYHFNRQLKETLMIRLFAGCDSYGDGEQQRDFIHVDDVAKVALWFLDHPDSSGLFNVGTGVSRSFNALAQAVISWHGIGEIEYIPFPDELRGSYQSFTQADLSRLRAVGYDHDFYSVEDGISAYMAWLNA